MKKHLIELVQYRELLWNLTISELKVRYRGSILGFLWTVLNPLFYLLQDHEVPDRQLHHLLVCGADLVVHDPADRRDRNRLDCEQSGIDKESLHPQDRFSSI